MMKNLKFWTVGSFDIEGDRLYSGRKDASKFHFVKVLPSIYLVTEGFGKLVLDILIFIAPIMFLKIKKNNSSVGYLILPSPVGLLFYLGTALLFIFSALTILYNIYIHDYGLFDWISFVLVLIVLSLFFYFNPVLTSFYDEMVTRRMGAVMDKLLHKKT